MTLSRILSAAIPALGLSAALSGSAFANQMPPRENLDRAKQIVIVLQQRVQDIVARAQGGGGNSNPGSCQQIRDPRTCAATQGCSWQDIGDSRYRCVQRPVIGFHPLAAADGDVDENDNAAEYALQGLGSQLFQLGQLIDQANLAWGTPGFWFPWGQACQKDGQLIWGAQAGKVAAQLPVVGFITPSDFDGIEQELDDVHSSLFCP